MSYDPKCRELAEHFLSDLRDPPGGYEPMSLANEEKYADELAQHIQDAVESWFRVPPQCIRGTRGIPA